MQLQLIVMWVTAVLIAAATHGQARVVITEIMYNPASMERAGETEWVEIANLGNQAVVMKDWRLDDEDRMDWGRFSGTLKPGEVMVLINAAAVSEAQFRAAWDVAPAEVGSAEPAANYQILPVQWGGLGNSPNAENEVLQLLNESDEVICEIKQSGDWPSCRDPDGPSVYLVDLGNTTLVDGTLWRRSEPATDGARNSRANEVFGAKDIGSPGTLPTGAAPAPRPAPAQTQPAPVPPPATPKPITRGGE